MVNFPYPLPEQWVPHINDDRIDLGSPTYQRGGTVSFKEHLGKPLTVALWEDVRHRLLCRHINVYPWNAGMKTIGHQSTGVFIHLDEKFLVHDIQFQS